VARCPQAVRYAAQPAGFACNHVPPVPRFMMMIQGQNWEDVDDVELPRLPSKGEPIEMMPDSEKYAGKIVCRLLT
jgi:hypothetical protein